MWPKFLGGSSGENLTLILPEFEIANPAGKILGIKLYYWEMDDTAVCPVELAGG